MNLQHRVSGERLRLKKEEKKIDLTEGSLIFFVPGERNTHAARRATFHRSAKIPPFIFRSRWKFHRRQKATPGRIRVRVVLSLFLPSPSFAPPAGFCHVNTWTATWKVYESVKK